VLPEQIGDLGIDVSDLSVLICSASRTTGAEPVV
jgi:hypothetical protein